MKGGAPCFLRESFWTRSSTEAPMSLLFTCKKPRGWPRGCAEAPKSRPTDPTRPAEHSHMLAEPIAQKNPPTPWATPNRPLRGRRPTAPDVGDAPTPHRLRRGRIDEMDTSSTRPSLQALC